MKNETLLNMYFPIQNWEFRQVGHPYWVRKQGFFGREKTWWIDLSNWSEKRSPNRNPNPRFFVTSFLGFSHEAIITNVLEAWILPHRKSFLGFQLWESQLKDATPEILLAKITPAKTGTNSSPKKRHVQWKKHIWTNHWFSAGHSICFSGEYCYRTRYSPNQAPQKIVTIN